MKRLLSMILMVSMLALCVSCGTGYDVLKISVLCVDDFLQTGQIAALVLPAYLALFIGFFFAIHKFKEHPTAYIGAAAVVGIVLKL